MTTRREFLRAAASATGAVFYSCGMFGAARAQQAQQARGGHTLPVMVNGKRIKTIDVHSHCLFHEAFDLMGKDAPPLNTSVKGANEAFIDGGQRLKAMDAMAVDMEVLSINPFWCRAERDLAAQIVELQNEKLAQLCASQPERFAAFGSLALQYPDLAVQQLEAAVKKQGLRGAAIGGSVAGEEFADPKSTRYGPRRRSSARSCSSIRRARRSSPSASKAMAG